MKLGYVIIYVPDVPATLAFYEAAFGLNQRFLHASGLYGELDTGGTILAFAGQEAADMAKLDIIPNTPNARPAGWEVCLVTDQVQAAFDRAVENGCRAVSPPQDKPWGQVVSYVQDLNGCLVEIASPVVGATADG